MKRISILLLVIIFNLLLTSCFNTERIDKRNVKWESDSGILEFRIEGMNKYLGYGTLSYEDITLEVVVALYSPAISLYIYDMDTINESIKKHNSNIVLLKFRGSKVANKATEFSFKTVINNTGNALFDDLSFVIKRTDIPLDELDASKHLDVKWENSENNVELSSLANIQFTNELNGFMNFNQTKTQVKLVFLENKRFTIFDKSTNTRIAEGSYQTSYIIGDKALYDDCKLILSFDFRAEGFNYPEILELSSRGF